MAPRNEGHEDVVVENNNELSITKYLQPLAEGCSRLYLCRHGETDHNCQGIVQGRSVNINLNEKGIAQGNLLAEAMRIVPLHAIYSSTLLRAQKTAQIVHRYHPEIPMESFAELEEMNYGIVEGHSYWQYQTELEEIEKVWQEQDQFHVAVPNGESPLDVVTRGMKKINQLMQQTYPQQHILMVTHGRLNRILLSQMKKGNLTEMKTLRQQNTCINVIDYDHFSHQYHVVIVNDTKHLSFMIEK